MDENEIATNPSDIRQGVATAERNNLQADIEEESGIRSPNEQRCGVCGGATDGFKCHVSGVESQEIDISHEHGDEKNGSSFNPKCIACQKAEVFCTCANTL